MRALVLALLAFGAQAQVPVPLDPLVEYRYLGTVARDEEGNTVRDMRVVRAFQKIWACPSTGQRTGACPGWAADHVLPLACGGADAVYNLQWLPNEIKRASGVYAKDRFERKVYGGNGLSKGCP